MVALTRILVPTNLGAPSRAALRYGVELARQFRARLFIVHVVTQADYDAAIEAERVLEQLVPEGGVATVSGVSEMAGRIARADIRLLTEAEERATHASYLLHPAGPDGVHAAIVAAAREVGAELIVIGKHGIGRVEHLLGGSVTERLIGHAPCPVLVVRQPTHEFVLPDTFEAPPEY